MGSVRGEQQRSGRGGEGDGETMTTWVTQAPPTNASDVPKIFARARLSKRRSVRLFSWVLAGTPSKDPTWIRHVRERRVTGDPPVRLIWPGQAGIWPGQGVGVKR